MDMSNNNSSAVLLEKMARCITHIKEELRSDRPAEVQIADVNTWCWCMIELAYRVQAAVNDELGDLEE